VKYGGTTRLCFLRELKLLKKIVYLRPATGWRMPDDAEFFSYPARHTLQPPVSLFSTRTQVDIVLMAFQLCLAGSLTSEFPAIKKWEVRQSPRP
jgi:hypothetical protein